ncbi:MAG TPA: sugar phosphate isomerase/epimerase family protein [Vicinamibacterales bacterium]|nr:sugar phosphate isomerase/epimerase family protein [Vicinamibacterales bacterium]
MVAPASTRPIRLAAITDEFSPDVDVALDAMQSVGMAGVELRTIGGRNIVDLSDNEVERIVAAAAAREMEIVSIASPLLKCVLSNGPPVDDRFQQDVFGSPFTFDDQPRLINRVFQIAGLTAARIVRVFSYWRTVDPPACEERIVTALHALAEEASRHDVTIGLENEYACNVGTAEESARLLMRLPHPNLQLIWDPANALILGDTPYPDGYQLLPRERVLHVHVKDCIVRDGRAVWGPIGEMGIDWRGQVRALKEDAYEGWLSLETHWKGPSGDKLEASVICGRRLRELTSFEEQ